MPHEDLITTAEAMPILGYTDPSSVVRLVREHRLAYAMKLPGKTGAYLFHRADVEKLAAEQAA